MTSKRTSTAGAAGQPPTLFARKASGLVKGWSGVDAFIYSFLSVNMVTLGFFIMTYGPFIPQGQLLTSVIFTGILVSFIVFVYAGLITTMPRAGGDYVWQSRVFGGGVAFVLAVTGWWFILWLWAPIYGNILSVEFFQPLAATFHQPQIAIWFGTKSGIFVVCLITIGLAALFVSLGMRGYSRVQKTCFVGGLIGFIIMVIVMAVYSHGAFVDAFNRNAGTLFGANGDVYSQTIATSAKAGYHPPDFGFTALAPSMLLVPMMVFYLLWPNWGATLYGEVRGAGDFRRVFLAMFLGLWVTVGLSVVFLALVNKTIGWDFYNAASNNYWAGNLVGVPIWPYPVMLVGWLVHSQVFQVILILLMSLWYFGWVGTLFLSSTRVIFAAAFDRVLPEPVSAVSSKRRVPWVALILMLVPAVIVSALYAYWGDFSTYTLDATLVIGVTFLGSMIAAITLPWRRPELWATSPASRYRIGPVPLLPIAGVVGAAFLVFNLFYWLKDGAYGVNNPASLIFMGTLYALAFVVYVVARVWRRRQGIDLSMVHREIPAE